MSLGDLNHLKNGMLSMQQWAVRPAYIASGDDNTVSCLADMELGQ